MDYYSDQMQGKIQAKAAYFSLLHVHRLFIEYTVELNIFSCRPNESERIRCQSPIGTNRYRVFERMHRTVVYGHTYGTARVKRSKSHKYVRTLYDAATLTSPLFYISINQNWAGFLNVISKNFLWRYLQKKIAPPSHGEAYARHLRGHRRGT